MTPHNTNTGSVLEAMVLPSLERGGYTCTAHVETGTRPGGRRRRQHYLSLSSSAARLRVAYPPP